MVGHKVRRRGLQAFQTILGHFIKLTSSTEILSREYPEKSTTQRL
jgi:hypothetical protein